MYLRCYTGVLLLAAILVSAEDPRDLEEDLDESRTKRHVTDDDKELLDAIADDSEYSDDVMEDPWWYGRGFGFRFGFRRRYWFDDPETYDPVEAGLADGMNDPRIAPSPRKCRKWCMICRTPRCRRRCRKYCPGMSDLVTDDPAVADYRAGEVNRQHRFWDGSGADYFPSDVYSDSFINSNCRMWCSCHTPYCISMCRSRCR